MGIIIVDVIPGYTEKIVELRVFRKFTVIAPYRLADEGQHP